MRFVVTLWMAGLALGMAAGLSTMEPRELAARLQTKGPAPAVFQVGPNVLYRSKHIPGAVYAGPAAETQGLAALRAATAKMPREREIVVYCGCCPWDHCPNVKPALDLLRGMGFTRVKALYIPTNFKADWIDRGYPVREGPTP
jgi:thiosulfate/3-mercaptopyruvate sulfurtransferase